MNCLDKLQPLDQFLRLLGACATAISARNSWRSFSTSIASRSSRTAFRRRSCREAVVAELVLGLEIFLSLKS